MNLKTGKNELKIIVVGNSGTGKTSFVNKWTKDTFTDKYKATIVSEFSHKVFDYKGKTYKIQLWDLAGQDQNTCITKIFSKDSHGCIVLSDVQNKASLEECVKWKGSVDDSTKFIDGDYLPSVLVRNKIDLLEGDLDDEEQVKQFAEENKFLNVFKTSAKMGIGINECMEFLITNIIERLEKCAASGKLEQKEDRASIVLQTKKATDKNENAGYGCC